ncbi:hypothetical protein BDQ17DRAFT_1387422 [Cyathus striatus]|nr:hypothetical protein BDQ17DRAFT_1387422 [Cyathus striatus]
MFNLFSRRHNKEPAGQDETIPWPATGNSKWSGKQLILDSNVISAPLPRGSPGSLTGFEHDGTGNWPYSQSSSGRASPLRSQTAWLHSSEALSEEPIPMQRGAPPPQVVRMESVPQPSLSHVFPISRSVSSPPTSPPYHSPLSSLSGPSPDETPSSKWGLRLHTSNINFSQSTQSLRLDARPHSYTTDVFGNAYGYPLAKQLSPIAEQDYISPDSARNSKGLPSVSDKNISRSESLTRSQRTNPSPASSQTSEIARPSPIYASPFITRQLNRTTSQTSSHLSATSSAPHLSAKSKSSDAPSVQPIDLKSSFPGYPGVTGPGPHPRPPRKSTVATMPTIIASSDGHMDEVYAGDDDDDDERSLHAESFISASSGHTTRLLAASIPQRAEDYDPETGSMRSGNSRLPSASESFITRRWDHDAGIPGRPRIRAKRQLVNATPAFWTFWFGFICPFLWLIGGWHFTNFGEQPPRLSFWEFYFNAGYWKEKLCLGRSKEERELRMSKIPPLPKWVTEKQLSDDGRARLNDPKRSLRGISFGYPFIPRPVRMTTRDSQFTRAGTRLISILEKPNRLFDHLYGVKLKEVRGRPESPRRMFDPWIQRCRYALCYAVLLLSMGLFTASIYLIVSNTRQLR